MGTETTLTADDTTATDKTSAAPGTAENQKGNTETKPADATQGATTDTTPEAKPADTHEGTKPSVQEELQLKLPEGVAADEALLTDFRAVAKEAGLKQEHAQKLVDTYVKALGRQEQGFEKQRAELSTQWLAEAKKDKELGGENFEKAGRVARLAVEQFASPTLKELLVSTGLGNHPEMIRFCNRIGKALGEDSVAGTSGGGVTGQLSEEQRLRLTYPTMFQE